MTGHPTNEGVGAAQSKTGQQAVPLNRGMGFNQTEDAMQSKTRSPHNAAGGPNYKYQDISKGTGGEVVGYGPGVGGSSDTPAGTHG
jgi:hypothetical protein